MFCLFLLFPTFLSVLSFWMKQPEKYQLNLNLTALNFQFWSVGCSSKTNQKKHAAVSDRASCKSQLSFPACTPSLSQHNDLLGMGLALLVCPGEVA